MDISRVGGSQNSAEIQRMQKVQPKKADVNVAASATKDSVQISSGARSAQLTSQVKKAVGNSPDVRKSKVAEAKLKLSQGKLINDKIIDKIADKIVSSLGLG